MTALYVIELAYVSPKAAMLLLTVIAASVVAAADARYRCGALICLGVTWLTYAGIMAANATQIALSQTTYTIRGEPLLPMLVAGGWIGIALALKRPVYIPPQSSAALIVAAIAQFTLLHPVTILQSMRALPRRYIDYPEYFQRIAMIEQVSAVIFVFGIGLFLAGWSRSVRLRQP